MTESTSQVGRSLIYGIIITVIGVGTAMLSNTFPDLPEGHPGPGLFPRLIGYLLAGCGLLLTWQGYRGKLGAVRHSLQGSWLLIALVFAIVLLYPWVHRFAGFPVALSLAIFGVALLLKLKVLKALVIALLTTASIYLLFNQLLHVPL